jgi:hypothetical protein
MRDFCSPKKRYRNLGFFGQKKNSERARFDFSKNFKSKMEREAQISSLLGRLVRANLANDNADGRRRKRAGASSNSYASLTFEERDYLERFARRILRSTLRLDSAKNNEREEKDAFSLSPRDENEDDDEDDDESAILDRMKSFVHERKGFDASLDVARLHNALNQDEDWERGVGKKREIFQLLWKLRRTGEDDDDEEDDDDDEVHYNPKGVPLGYDGRPIPFWLFKLHGLRVTYSCEICGNEVYKGRRKFEEHFQQEKHALGLRCLGIPNTPHFHGITKIKDAVALLKKLRQERQGAVWTAESEECEDSRGNVMSKTTYDDLVREGLL